MVRYMLLNDKVVVSVCDGCSNWHICKFSEDVKRIEKQFIQMQENMNLPECIETVMSCKYKQYASDALWNYREPISNKGNPPF